MAAVEAGGDTSADEEISLLLAQANELLEAESMDPAAATGPSPAPAAKPWHPQAQAQPRTQPMPEERLTTIPLDENSPAGSPSAWAGPDEHRFRRAATGFRARVGSAAPGFTGNTPGDRALAETGAGAEADDDDDAGDEESFFAGAGSSLYPPQAQAQSCESHSMQSSPPAFQVSQAPVPGDDEDHGGRYTQQTGGVADTRSSESDRGFGSGPSFNSNSNSNDNPSGWGFSSFFNSAPPPEAATSGDPFGSAEEAPEPDEDDGDGLDYFAANRGAAVIGGGQPTVGVEAQAAPAPEPPTNPSHFWQPAKASAQAAEQTLQPVQPGQSGHAAAAASQDPPSEQVPAESESQQLDEIPRQPAFGFLAAADPTTNLFFGVPSQAAPTASGKSQPQPQPPQNPMAAAFAGLADADDDSETSDPEDDVDDDDPAAADAFFGQPHPVQLQPYHQPAVPTSVPGATLNPSQPQDQLPTAVDQPIVAQTPSDAASPTAAVAATPDSIPDGSAAHREAEQDKDEGSNVEADQGSASAAGTGSPIPAEFLDQPSQKQPSPQHPEHEPATLMPRPQQPEQPPQPEQQAKPRQFPPAEPSPSGFASRIPKLPPAPAVPSRFAPGLPPMPALPTRAPTLPPQPPVPAVASPLAGAAAPVVPHQLQRSSQPQQPPQAPAPAPAIAALSPALPPIPVVTPNMPPRPLVAPVSVGAGVGMGSAAPAAPLSPAAGIAMAHDAEQQQAQPQQQTGQAPSVAQQQADLNRQWRPRPAHVCCSWSFGGRFACVFPQTTAPPSQLFAHQSSALDDQQQSHNAHANSLPGSTVRVFSGLTAVAKRSPAAAGSAVGVGSPAQPFDWLRAEVEAAESFPGPLVDQQPSATQCRTWVATHWVADLAQASSGAQEEHENPDPELALRREHRRLLWSAVDALLANGGLLGTERRQLQPQAWLIQALRQVLQQKSPAPAAPGATSRVLPASKEALSADASAREHFQRNVLQSADPDRELRGLAQQLRSAWLHGHEDLLQQHHVQPQQQASAQQPSLAGDAQPVPMTVEELLIRELLRPASRSTSADTGFPGPGDSSGGIAGGQLGNWTRQLLGGLRGGSSGDPRTPSSAPGVAAQSQSMFEAAFGGAQAGILRGARPEEEGQMTAARLEAEWSWQASAVSSATASAASASSSAPAPFSPAAQPSPSSAAEHPHLLEPALPSYRGGGGGGLPKRLFPLLEELQGLLVLPDLQPTGLKPLQQPQTSQQSPDDAAGLALLNHFRALVRALALRHPTLGRLQLVVEALIGVCVLTSSVPAAPASASTTGAIVASDAEPLWTLALQLARLGGIAGVPGASAAGPLAVGGAPAAGAGPGVGPGGAAASPWADALAKRVARVWTDTRLRLGSPLHALLRLEDAAGTAAASPALGGGFLIEETQRRVCVPVPLDGGSAALGSGLSEEKHPLSRASQGGAGRPEVLVEACTLVSGLWRQLLATLLFQQHQAQLQQAQAFALAHAAADQHPQPLFIDWPGVLQLAAVPGLAHEAIPGVAQVLSMSAASPSTPGMMASARLGHPGGASAAAVFAAAMQRLGDVLQRHRPATAAGSSPSRGRTEAAQLCYLLAAVVFEPANSPSARLVVLGGDHRSAAPEGAPTPNNGGNSAAGAAAQLLIAGSPYWQPGNLRMSELWEYGKQQAALAASGGGSAKVAHQACAPSLQVYKYLYAGQLAEFGLPDKALAYAEAVLTTVRLTGQFDPAELMAVLAASQSAGGSEDPARTQQRLAEIRRPRGYPYSWTFLRQLMAFLQDLRALKTVHSEAAKDTTARKLVSALTRGITSLFGSGSGNKEKQQPQPQPQLQPQNQIQPQQQYHQSQAQQPRLPGSGQPQLHPHAPMHPGGLAGQSPMNYARSLQPSQNPMQQPPQQQRPGVMAGAPQLHLMPPSAPPPFAAPPAASSGLPGAPPQPAAADGEIPNGFPSGASAAASASGIGQPPLGPGPGPALAVQQPSPAALGLMMPAAPRRGASAMPSPFTAPRMPQFADPQVPSAGQSAAAPPTPVAGAAGAQAAELPSVARPQAQGLSQPQPQPLAQSQSIASTPELPMAQQPQALQQPSPATLPVAGAPWLPPQSPSSVDGGPQQQPQPFFQQPVPQSPTPSNPAGAGAYPHAQHAPVDALAHPARATGVQQPQLPSFQLAPAHQQPPQPLAQPHLSPSVHPGPQLPPRPGIQNSAPAHPPQPPAQPQASPIPQGVNENEVVGARGFYGLEGTKQNRGGLLGAIRGLFGSGDAAVPAETDLKSETQFYFDKQRQKWVRVGANPDESEDEGGDGKGGDGDDSDLEPPPMLMAGGGGGAAQGLSGPHGQGMPPGAPGESQPMQQQMMWNAGHPYGGGGVTSRYAQPAWQR